MHRLYYAQTNSRACRPTLPSCRSGTLPDLFSRNEALVYLDVTNNSLSGKCPA